MNYTYTVRDIPFKAVIDTLNKLKSMKRVTDLTRVRAGAPTYKKVNGKYKHYARSFLVKKFLIPQIEASIKLYKVTQRVIVNEAISDHFLLGYL